MLANGILQWVEELQTPTVEPTLVNMAATWELESKHHNKHQHRTNESVAG